jgi:hypothetical protein
MDTISMDTETNMHFIEIPTIEDIAYFIGANSRAENDMANKVREDILLSLYNDFPEQYFTNKTYGHIWTNIRNKFKTIIDTLFLRDSDSKSKTFANVILEKKAGMSHNYDFVVSYIDENNNIIKQIKLEFKNNNTNISKLPQILELYDSDMSIYGKYKMTPYTYAEYYYDEYLDDYLVLDNTITEKKPQLEEYLRHVKDIKYKHPFFRNLYESKDKSTNLKQQLVNQSIANYLKDYAPDFDFKEIEKKLKDSQSNKIFLFWDGNNFRIDEIVVDEIEIKDIIKIGEKYIDLEVNGLQYNIRLRFNWGNNNGVANPRWKFTFI